MKNALKQKAQLSMALLLGVVLLGGSVRAQTPLNWRSALNYDTGVQPSVALLPTGLVVEFHKSQRSQALFYHVGKIAQNVNGTYSVLWGNSQPLEYEGDRPNVSITREGYVLLVYTKGAYTGYGNEVQMRYWVGELNPAGSNTQTIAWRIKDGYFDTGQYASTAFNSTAALIEVHEGFHTDRLFYRVGRFNDPARHNFDLVWENGSGGVRYDKGVRPSVSINDSNQIVECHQSEASNSLFYRRGRLVGTSISFASTDSSRYDNDARTPRVALTKQGVAIEVSNRNKAPFSRTGTLDVGDPARIDWSNSVGIGTSGLKEPSPSVATNGNLALAAWSFDDRLYYSIATIR